MTSEIRSGKLRLYDADDHNGHRTIDLGIASDGGITCTAYDRGPLVEQVWRGAEYEFSVGVPPTELHRVVLALLRERYLGKASAVDDFRAWCDAEGIANSFFNWVAG